MLIAQNNKCAICEISLKTYQEKDEGKQMEYIKEWQDARKNQDSAYRPPAQYRQKKNLFEVLEPKGPFKEGAIVKLVDDDFIGAPAFKQVAPIDIEEVYYANWWRLKPVKIVNTKTTVTAEGSNNGGKTFVLNLTNIQAKILYQIMNYNFKTEEDVLKKLPHITKAEFVKEATHIYNKVSDEITTSIKK